MHVSIKNGQQNHKEIVAPNIVCTCMQHRSTIKHVSTLHVSCSDVHYTALHADIALTPKEYSMRSVLGLACYFVVCVSIESLFGSHWCAISLNFHEGQGPYVLRRCMNSW